MLLKNKEKIIKKSGERYQNLFDEDKNKKQECGGERYKGLSKTTEKQRLIQYKKKYYEMLKIIARSLNKVPICYV